MTTDPFTSALVASLLGLFAMCNPIGNTAIFIGMTEGVSTSFRVRAAGKVGLATLVILLGSLFGATALLEAFGISMNAFQAAGGLIVLHIGLKMLNGNENPAHTTDSIKASVSKPAQAESEVAGKLIVPLAMPLLAGPGSIAAVVTVAAGHPGMEGKLGTALGVALISVAVFVCFAASGLIGRLLNEQAQEILLRFMGLILTAIAVGMIFHGVLGAVGEFLTKHPLPVHPS